MKFIYLSVALVLLFPATLWAAYPDCPTPTTGAADLEAWRASAISHIYGGDAAMRIEQCFPTAIPACLKRVHDNSEINMWLDVTPFEKLSPEEREKRSPPKEFFGPTSLDSRVPPQITLFQTKDGRTVDVEEVARAKGWPMVRYKSRHSGGFDPGTPSLLMIRVPGDRMIPPVDYDRYINIALPADPDDLNSSNTLSKPVPTAKIPTQSDYDSEARGRTRLPYTMTIVTLQKHHGDTPSKVYFTRFMRSGYGSPFFSSPIIEPPRTSCYTCHPNGIREISPLGFHVRGEEQRSGNVKPDAWWEATREMNNSMNSGNGFHMTDWGTGVDSKGKVRKLINPEAEGPVYGPIHPLTRTTTRNADGTTQVTYPTRSEAFIMGTPEGIPGCATIHSSIRLTDIFGRAPGRNNVYTLTASPAINWQKVANAMNCATCHNNRIRAALVSRTDPGTIKYKILVDQSMPVGAHRDPLAQGAHNVPVQDELNPNERIALANCLEAEFNQEQQRLPEWLAQPSCTANQSVSSPVDAPAAAVPLQSVSTQADPGPLAPVAPASLSPTASTAQVPAPVASDATHPVAVPVAPAAPVGPPAPVAPSAPTTF